MASMRVGIVEDDPLLSGEIVAAVTAAGFTVVGTAATLAEGRLLARKALDVLLLDLGLPDGRGHELIANVRCKVIVLTIFADVTSVIRAIELGADGYLLKDAGSTAVADAIRLVLEGGAPISPAVASHLLARLRRERARPVAERLPLTSREISLLEGLAKGLSFKELAGLFGVSHYTISDHAKAIYRKLAVNSRAEAVFEAVQAGIITMRDG